LHVAARASRQGRRLDRAGTDGIDPDVLLGVVQCRRLGHPGDGMYLVRRRQSLTFCLCVIIVTENNIYHHIYSCLNARLPPTES